MQESLPHPCQLLFVWWLRRLIVQQAACLHFYITLTWAPRKLMNGRHGVERSWVRGCYWWIREVSCRSSLIISASHPKGPGFVELGAIACRIRGCVRAMVREPAIFRQPPPPQSALFMICYFRCRIRCWLYLFLEIRHTNLNFTERFWHAHTCCVPIK